MTSPCFYGTRQRRRSPWPVWLVTKRLSMRCFSLRTHGWLPALPSISLSRSGMERRESKEIISDFGYVWNKHSCITMYSINTVCQMQIFFMLRKLGWPTTLAKTVMQLAFLMCKIDRKYQCIQCSLFYSCILITRTSKSLDISNAFIFLYFQ